MAMIIVGSGGGSSGSSAASAPNATSIGPVVASTTGSFTTLNYQVLVRQLTADQLSAGQTPGVDFQFISQQAVNHVVGLTGLISTGANATATIRVFKNYGLVFTSNTINLQGFTDTAFSFAVTGVAFAANDILTFKCAFGDYTRDGVPTYSYLYPFVTLGA